MKGTPSNNNSPWSQRVARGGREERPAQGKEIISEAINTSSEEIGRNQRFSTEGGRDSWNKPVGTEKGWREVGG